ncbi:hypothetical protein GCM10010272_38140 [Streptomyces lateritius]|nr:hypothetical protein GCM10010272_38140 [Streptomyces lateritius]
MRAAVADRRPHRWVEVRYDPGARPSPGAAVPGCPDPVPLGEAGRWAGFEPLTPKALGAPDAVAVTGSAERGRAVISLCRREGKGIVRPGRSPATLDGAFGAGQEPVRSGSPCRTARRATGSRPRPCSASR